MITGLDRRRTRAWRLLIAGLIFIVLSGCTTVGSGEIDTRVRTLDDFDRIVVNGGIGVDVLVDAGAAQEVSVTIDDNLFDQLVTRVEERTLIVEFEGSVQTVGGGRFVGVITDELLGVEVNGGSTLQGSGQTDILRVRASGGAEVDLRDLTTQEVILDASGGSSVTIFASESVIGDASGGATVTVFGDPATSTIELSGGAEVNTGS